MEFPKPNWNDPDVAGETVKVEVAPVEGSEVPPEELEDVRNLTAELARAVEAEGFETPENRENARKEAAMFTQEAERTGGILNKIVGSKPLRALAMYGLLGLSAMAATVGGKPEQAEASHQRAAATSTVDWGGIVKEGARGATQIYRERQAQESQRQRERQAQESNERRERIRQETELRRAEQQAEIAQLRAKNDLELAKMRNEQQLRNEEIKLNQTLIKAKSDKERAQIDSRLQIVRAAIASKQTKAVEVTMEGETGTARVGVGQEAKDVGSRSAPQPERPTPQTQEGAKTTPAPPAEEGGI